MVEAGAIPIKIVQRDHNRQQREHSRTMCCPSATWGCGLLLLATVCLTATASVKLVDTDIHEKKVVWLSGMQLEGFNGRQAEYIANSSSYLDSYAVALESALTNAPSLQPVLVIQGHIDDKVVEDLKAVGAIVIRHTLSFRNKLQEYTPELITGLWGSYLRIDIPHIMPKIERLVDAQHVETNYVLWTDPDVIFLQDVNSSVLAKPRYLAIGPDASPDLAENGGVIYFNVSGYSEVFDDLMDWSEQHQFNFRWVDQSMLVGYFNQGGVQRISQLPNVFNWKPYWGRPGNNIKWNRLPNIIIVHFHGPKLELAECVIKYFKSHKIGRYEATWWLFNKKNEDAVSAQCGCRSKHVTCDLLFNLLAHAYSVDEGEFIAIAKEHVAAFADKAAARRKMVSSLGLP